MTKKITFKSVRAIFFPAFFVVCLSIFTTLPVPALVKLLILKGNIRFDQVEDNLSGLLTAESDIDEDLV